MFSKNGNKPKIIANSVLHANWDGKSINRVAELFK